MHDLPDYVYFNHEIHVNKGIGCASCHGRVDQMPLMYMQNTLQMEWCLNCHRNPAVNLRPTSEIYNMAWTGPSTDKPVWCAAEDVRCADRRQRAGVTCTKTTPGGKSRGRNAAGASDGSGMRSCARPVMASRGDGRDACAGAAKYTKFTSQMDLGRYLTAQYHIRNPRELTSCETCHR